MWGVVEAGIQEDQVRGATNEAHRAILQMKLAHPPAQLFLESRDADQRFTVGDGRLRRGSEVTTVGDDGLGNIVQAFAGPDLANQVGHFRFGIVEDGLDEGLKGGIMRLEIVDVFLVDAFSSMIRVGVVDAFSAVDGSTSGAARGVSIALGGRSDAESEDEKVQG